MHGRLKIKTTAEQEEEKRKEREIKKKKYLAGLNIVFTKRKENVSDKEGLDVAANLLSANPDALSLWNFRREALLQFKKELVEESDWQNTLLDELKTTEYCLLKNPKSYGAWHHRDWIFRVIPKPPYDEELEVCDRYLQKDERNFHCWDHRRLIVRRSNRSLSDELTFTQTLIEKNFSNYSAWHYRSKLLPLIYPPSSESPHPIPEDIFIKELNKVVTAVFTDPSDQSPWFFLRWLLGGKENKRRLMQIGIVPSLDEAAAELVLVFDEQVYSLDELSVRVNETLVPNDQLKPSGDKSLWLLHIPRSEKLSISVKTSCDTEKVIEIESDFSSLPYFEWVSKDLFGRGSISEKARKSLLDIMDNCVTLDQLEPGNKWVLLTLVNIMSMVDLAAHLHKVLGYLDQLQVIDPLRFNYYGDLRSKIIMEEKMKQGITHDAFDLSNEKISRIVHSQYLSGVKKINLQGNNIRSLNPVTSFLSCTNLVLDNNPIKDISPIMNLRRLRNLSLNSCGINSIKVLEDLRSLKSLVALSVKDNPDLETLDGLENSLKLIIKTLVEVEI